MHPTPARMVVPVWMVKMGSLAFVLRVSMIHIATQKWMSAAAAPACMAHAMMISMGETFHQAQVQVAVFVENC